MGFLTFLHRRRYAFGRVFWVTAAIYLGFNFLGLLALYFSPANQESNWSVFFSWVNLLSKVFSTFFFSFFFFVSLNMFYRLFAGKHRAVTYLQPVAVSLLLLGFYFTVSLLFLNKLKYHASATESSTESDLPAGLLVFAFVMSALVLTGLSMLVAYFTYLRDERKQRKVLEEQKMQLEVEKSQANFNFLKAQINPHFLHNTLNFLYAKSLPYSTELSEGILTLSDIMRYSLGPAAREGIVPLKEEIEHVRNVIKINQLRFSNNLNVSMEVQGVLNGATVVPFVLITLVENAFKHGDLKDETNPIVIRLEVDGHEVKFYCRNKKKSGAKELSTGIGLDNIKKQLDLTYGRNYLLDVKDEADFYTTQLTIHSA